MRSMNQAAADARLFAEARAGYRWLVRSRLIVGSKEAWQEFLAGYLAMEGFYRARDAMRSTERCA
ncbi:MAG: hypothetical protein DMF56_09350 [Acidobacteria bacterium]|nr:MAG: hypothetical protein DMF56_09350 [Acidobacteriota bacterium]